MKSLAKAATKCMDQKQKKKGVVVPRGDSRTRKFHDPASFS